jgi:hypothetical protein
MIARWSVEGLVHAVSIEDNRARNLLALRMTIAEYDLSINGDSESKSLSQSSKNAYRFRVFIDSVILAGFAALFLMLTMWALKRKDTL